ncbi:MAG: integrase [Bacteroidetes bacterium]|nr:MAG: integrase [Bacteroidota bacterium]
MSGSPETCIQEFLDYLKFEKRYSQLTTTAYQNDLFQFYDFLNRKFGRVSIEEINAPLVKSWLVDLKEHGNVAKSINRKISTLKSYFKFHLRMGKLEQSPMTTVVAPRMSKRLPAFINQNEAEDLFVHTQFSEGWQGETERMILATLYGTGIRVSELVNIKKQHLDLSNSNLKVLGKGNKERIIPLSPELIKRIEYYLSASENLEEQTDHDFFLLNEQGKKLNTRYVYSVVRGYLSRVTTIEKKGPHTLRHSFATHLMNNGADLNAVKELLGHSSLASTQVYTHNTIDKLKDIYKKAHPKA